MYITKSNKMQLTAKQFSTLNDLFDYYNETLFGGTLEQCLVNLSRHRGAHGFFAPGRWKDGEKTVHEISINPDSMNRPDKEWHSTLVHEMCHLWQETQGKAPRKCYHDKQFAAKMDSVGLVPSNTGQPGGKRTGQNMTHYVQAGGPFETAFNAIGSENLEALKLPLKPSRPHLDLAGLVAKIKGSETEGETAEEESKPKSGVKIKYSCGCGNNVWGKSGLKITCDDCEEPYKEQE